MELFFLNKKLFLMLSFCLFILAAWPKLAPSKKKTTTYISDSHDHRSVYHVCIVISVCGCTPSACQPNYSLLGHRPCTRLCRPGPHPLQLFPGLTHALQVCPCSRLGPRSQLQGFLGRPLLLLPWGSTAGLVW